MEAVDTKLLINRCFSRIIFRKNTELYQIVSVIKNHSHLAKRHFNFSDDHWCSWSRCVKRPRSWRRVHYGILGFYHLIRTLWDHQLCSTFRLRSAFPSALSARNDARLFDQKCDNANTFHRYTTVRQGSELRLGMWEDF